MKIFRSCAIEEFPEKKKEIFSYEVRFKNSISTIISKYGINEKDIIKLDGYHYLVNNKDEINNILWVEYVDIYDVEEEK